MDNFGRPTAASINAHPLFRYKITDSTNARLKSMAREGAAHGTVVLADEQTAGRGRFDRKWLSRPGVGAWFSLLIRPEKAAVPAEAASGLVFLAALGMAEALNSRSPGSITVKWPNDLIAGRKKIAGILCEMSASDMSLDWAVIGIGVNLTGRDFPRELPWAGSFEGETGKTIAPEACVAEFLTRFDSLYSLWLSEGLSPILARLSRISATIGKRVRVTDANECAFEADAVAFAPDGSLIVNHNGAFRALCAGDVSVRGIMDYAQEVRV